MTQQPQSQAVTTTVEEMFYDWFIICSVEPTALTAFEAGFSAGQDSAPPAPHDAVRDTTGSFIRWQQVNGEPLEYAIQQGPHGDEFIKLLDGSCLSRTPAVDARQSQCGVQSESVREALTLGRDAVIESFKYVKSKDDQYLADMRLQSIDAVLTQQEQGDGG